MDNGARQRDRGYCLCGVDVDGAADVKAWRSGGRQRGTGGIGFVGSGVVDDERDRRLFPIKIALSMVRDLDVDSRNGVVDSITFKPCTDFFLNFADDELVVYVI